MLISAAACGAFASAATGVAFGAIYLVNGLAQSTGWPGTTKAMAEWTYPDNRGTVMSFWATCYQAGGLVAGFVAAFLLGRYGWRSTFLVPAAWMALIALVVFALLRPGPNDGRSSEAKDAEPPSAELARLRKEAQKRVFKSPALWCYGSSYFFIKFIRYALALWLPYYLANTLHYAGDHAGYISVAFEFGGIPGVIAIGTFSDRTRRFSRPLLSAMSLVGLALALLLFWRLEQGGVWANVLSLALIGTLLYAPDSLLSGAAAQDAADPRAAGSATGMVNGIGSIGALLVGLTLPQLSKHFGWGVLFPVLGAMAFCAALALTPVLLPKKPRAT